MLCPGTAVPKIVPGIWAMCLCEVLVSWEIIALASPHVLFQNISGTGHGKHSGDGRTEGNDKAIP